MYEAMFTLDSGDTIEVRKLAGDPDPAGHFGVYQARGVANTQLVTTSEGDVVAASRAGVRPVERELLGAQPREAGLLVQDLGLLEELPPARHRAGGDRVAAHRLGTGPLVRAGFGRLHQRRRPAGPDGRDHIRDLPADEQFGIAPPRFGQA